MISVSVLNFTGVYERESFYKDGDCEWIDCSDLSGVNGFCDEASMKEIEARIRLDSLYRRRKFPLFKLSHDEENPGAVYPGGI